MTAPRPGWVRRSCTRSWGREVRPRPSRERVKSRQPQPGPAAAHPGVALWPHMRPQINRGLGWSRFSAEGRLVPARNDLRVTMQMTRVAFVLLGVHVARHHHVRKGAVGEHGASLDASLILTGAVGVVEHYTRQSVSWPIYAAIVGVLCMIAFYRVWLDEHRQRTALEAAAAPRLSMHYEAGVPPYVHDVGVDRYFRVAVRNNSMADITGIRLVLESCNHPTATGINLGHRLQVMGAPRGTDATSVAPGPYGVMFDVVGEVRWMSRPTQVRIFYAADSAPQEIDRKVVWRIVLRAEGAGPVVRGTFVIRENGATHKIEMIHTED